jgi:hypothetical protein
VVWEGIGAEVRGGVGVINGVGIGVAASETEGVNIPIPAISNQINLKEKI